MIGARLLTRTATVGLLAAALLGCGRSEPQEAASDKKAAPSDAGESGAKPRLKVTYYYLPG